MGAQLLQGDAARRQLVPEGGIDVSVPEVRAEAQPGREVEDDPEVGTGLARGATSGRPELDERLGVLAVLEADLQRLGLERAGDRQHDVGELAVGVMNRSAWTKKSSVLNASRPRALSA